MDISVSDAQVGRLLDGRYRVEATLARGGMATVYRALDTRLDRVVALKVMHPELAMDDEFVARFIGEARSVARLSHPNVVGVFDQGADGGSVFLAMEYVEGQTLRQLLRDRGRLDPAEAVEMIEPVLAALGAAHEAGIVHRDVKPENVLVGDNGRVKVADFGLARALHEVSSATRELLLGTVNYISPEQAMGELASPRSDVYSAGIMLYELLTGSTPHADPTDLVVVRNHIDNDVPAPSAVDPAIPAGIDQLVRQATARDPWLRFATAGDFLAAVAEVRPSIGTAVAGLESRESAGVSVDEALTRLAGPAGAPPVRPWETTVIPARPEHLHPPPPRRHRRAGPEPSRRAAAPPPRLRRSIAFGVLLLLIAGITAGAWWLGEGRYVTTPSLLNLSFAEAEVKAAEFGLRVRQGPTEPSETYEAGVVMRTEPAPNSRILRGVPIEVITSSGPERFVVPDVRGRTLGEAREALAAANLTIDGPEERYDDQVEQGRVIDQGVAPGKELKRGEPVPISVSLGRQPLDITDYTGLPAVDAHKALTDLGFVVTVTEESRPNVNAGVVISQAPSSGQGYRGDTVALVVASATDRMVMPSVVGMHVDSAVQTLRNAGFTNIEVREDSAVFPLRIVREQQPRAGREVGRDQKIVLRVR